jgi:hypothetical protein
MTSETTSPKFTRKRLILMALLGLLLLFLLWLGLKTWRIYQAGNSLLARQAEVETLLADGLSNIDPDAVEKLVLDTRQDIYTLKDETAVFLPFTPYLGWLPKVGSTLTAAPQLVDMAVAGSDAAAYAVRGLKPALVLMQTPDMPDRFTALVNAFAHAAPDLQAAHAAVQQVSAARAEIDNASELPWRLQQAFILADHWLPLAEKGLSLSPILPELLGQNGPRTYLLLAQNEDERRGTGGFIAGAGSISVENGRLSEINMVDAYTIDNYLEKPYDVAPQPMADYMGLDLFLFRDANFWPDFPTSANKAMDLFSYGQSLPPLDGAIAIDQEFLRLLVQATGPIPVSSEGDTITAQNITTTLQDAWAAGDETSDAPWINERKAFIGVFANAIRNHLENNLGQVDLPLLAQNMAQALEGRHLQIYLRHPEAQEILAETGWNGRLVNPPAQDFFAVVDTNMGFNKSNIYIERETDYRVALADNGDSEGVLTVTYTHTGADSGEPCYQYDLSAYTEVPDYLNVANGCYFNYLRLYLPENTVIIDAARHTTAGQYTRSGEAISTSGAVVTEMPGFITVSNFLMVPYAQSVSSQYHYTVPAVVAAQEDGSRQYQLFVRKQGGSDPESVTITVTLPAGAAVVSAIPAPVALEGNNLIFSLQLDGDKLLTLNYR